MKKTMETIFKVGDKVFDYPFGWGVVSDITINININYPIEVRFNNNKIHPYEYNKDGCLYKNSKPTLSFTEYTLEGFNQERSMELPKRGDIVWVRDTNYNSWIVAHFIGKQDEKYLTSDSNNEDYVNSWKFLTTKNPYADEQK